MQILGGAKKDQHKYKNMTRKYNAQIQLHILKIVLNNNGKVWPTK